MPQEKIHRSRSRHVGVDAEEEKAWIRFYRHVGNPAIATEVMHQLESDPEMKRTHLALYLLCKESLRTQKARQTRNKRIGQFIRMLSAVLFAAPATAIQKLLRQSGDLAVECLPEVSKEPAVRHVKRLVREAEFAQAQSEFDSQAMAPASQQTSTESTVKVSFPASKTGNSE